MNWLGASGGVDFFHAAIRSPRTTVSNSKAIKPNASDTTCITVAPGRRCNAVTAKRHAEKRNRLRIRLSDNTPAHAISANNSMPPRKPAAVSRPSLRSPVCHNNKPRNIARPSAYVARVSGCGASCSRRMTRLCGTLRNCSTGGNAKPTSSSKPVAMPCAAGNQPASGKSLATSAPSHSSNT